MPLSASAHVCIAVCSASDVGLNGLVYVYPYGVVWTKLVE